MKPLRLVVWGLGRHAIGKILPAAAAARGVELYGVCSRNRETVSSCSEQWSCQGWTDPATMLRDQAVDVVYLATPIALHAANGQQVLAAGKHLWCEKPLTSDLADTLALIDASRGHGLSLCEGHMYLHHPQFSQLSAYLSSGRLGSVRSVECRFGIPPLDNPGFRSDPALGGGALFDVGCYPISAIGALFPTATAHRVSSRVDFDQQTGQDTAGYATVELSNRILCFLEWRTNVAYRNEISIWGAEGSLFTDKIFSKPHAYVPTFVIRDNHGNSKDEQTCSADHFVAMLNWFSSAAYDPAAAEAERHRIAWTAALVDQIWRAA